MDVYKAPRLNNMSYVAAELSTTIMTKRGLCNAKKKKYKRVVLKMDNFFPMHNTIFSTEL